MLRAAVVENLKNIIVVGETVDGDLTTFCPQSMDDARYSYMLLCALNKIKDREYEPTTEEIEFDDDEEGLDEADGEATPEATQEGTE